MRERGGETQPHPIGPDPALGAVAADPLHPAAGEMEPGERSIELGSEVSLVGIGFDGVSPGPIKRGLEIDRQVRGPASGPLFRPLIVRNEYSWPDAEAETANPRF